jgi:hypothetical protein
MKPFSRSLFSLIAEAAAGDTLQGELLIPGNRFTVGHWFKRARLRHNGQ